MEIRPEFSQQRKFFRNSAIFTVPFIRPAKMRTNEGPLSRVCPKFYADENQAFACGKELREKSKILSVDPHSSLLKNAFGRRGRRREESGKGQLKSARKDTAAQRKLSGGV
jgi:hypothetical protein